ncbi:hypothetical protein [Rhizobium sp. BK176]|uniref:hypothetical protein n=1 Tax=Rhizobium sp. BK176 TaxID=2587071 RepID=UPI0021697448|nr:hypothetical protein [Rhizobium sp. BK176]MCS4088856.1 hypothetical protein [Rhizobium sp. BK176]
MDAFAKPRGSAGSFRNFRERVAVEIREASPEEAPVAMQWDGGRAGPMETRWHDGSHWAILDRETDVTRRGVTAAEIFRIFDSPMDRNFYSLIRGYFEKSDYSSVDLDRSKFVDFDDRSLLQAHENVRAWADDCLIVDGMLYTRCPEPMYHVGVGGITVVIERPKETREGRRFETIANPFRTATLFRADRYEEAAATFAAAWPNQPLAPEPPITVLVEESLVVDADRDCLVNTCIDALTMFNRESMMTIPPAVLATLAPIAACLWNTAKVDVDADAAHAALTGLSEAVRATGYDLSHMDGNPSWAIDIAIDRWDNRPVALPSMTAPGGPRR